MVEVCEEVQLHNHTKCQMQNRCTHRDGKPPLARSFDLCPEVEAQKYGWGEACDPDHGPPHDIPRYYGQELQSHTHKGYITSP